MDDLLSTRDVAALLDVKPATIRFYRAHSKPGGRYEAHPFPEPDCIVGVVPAWSGEREPELLAWASTRAGRGAGGGRPPRAATGTAGRVTKPSLP